MQELIQNVSVVDMKGIFLQYATKVSRELPLLHRLQPQHLAEPPNNKSLNDGSKGNVPDVPRVSRVPDLPGISMWPRGSLWFVRNTSLEVFCEKLVQLPPVLSQMTSLSSQELLRQLQPLVPQLSLCKLLANLLAETAGRQAPVQKPGCLLLSEKDVVVLSSKESSQVLSVDHFNLGEVQISLAGQHVRLLGCFDDRWPFPPTAKS